MNAPMLDMMVRLGWLSETVTNKAAVVKAGEEWDGVKRLNRMAVDYLKIRIQPRRYAHQGRQDHP